jgi:hypothetical protein
VQTAQVLTAPITIIEALIAAFAELLGTIVATALKTLTESLGERIDGTRIAHREAISVHIIVIATDIVVATNVLVSGSSPSIAAATRGKREDERGAYS